MKIKVCDAPMGSGKTEAAIAKMNEDTGSKYLFITPYLKEVDRIKESCQKRGFATPRDNGTGKLNDLNYLLSKGRNIASTHALFKKYTDETRQLIKNGGYKLILDETFDVIDTISLLYSDIDLMLKCNILKEEKDSERILWAQNDYTSGGIFCGVAAATKAKKLVRHNEHYFCLLFPIEMFEVFRETLVLTYMYPAQMQCHYFQVYGVEPDYVGVQRRDGGYRFTTSVPTYNMIGIKEKIHIFGESDDSSRNDAKLNSIGAKRTALSSQWFDKKNREPGAPQIERLRKNLMNLFRNKYKVADGDDIAWTTYQKAKEHLAGNGFKKSFLPFNIRSTNEYMHKKYLAYCINVFYNPFIKNYFTSHGVKVDEDGYALSVMIQWIWRSAIRKGEEIWIYIPSSRMRGLLKDWLESL